MLLICSSFSRENGHLFLICSSLSTAQIFFEKPFWKPTPSFVFLRVYLLGCRYPVKLPGNSVTHESILAGVTSTQKKNAHLFSNKIPSKYAHTFKTAKSPQKHITIDLIDLHQPFFIISSSQKKNREFIISCIFRYSHELPVPFLAKNPEKKTSSPSTPVLPLPRRRPQSWPLHWTCPGSGGSNRGTPKSILGRGQPNMGVQPKIWENPQIIHFYRVCHYFHHPFWVKTPLIFGNTQYIPSLEPTLCTYFK